MVCHVHFWSHAPRARVNESQKELLSVRPETDENEEQKVGDDL